MFPVTDWQFWVASLVVLAVVVWMVRRVVGRKRSRQNKPASLTIEGRKPGR